MGIVLKHTLKNIFKRPFRTILVMFCITVCTVSALLTFDMTGALESLISNVFGDMIGTMDILVETQGCDPDCVNNISDFPENNTIALYYLDNSFVHDIEGEYTYMHQDTLSIVAFDMDKAYEMRAVPFDTKLNLNEAILSKDFADKYKYKAGDTIILHDIDKNECEFTVSEVYDYEEKGILATNSALISMDSLSNLCNGELKVSELAIDLKDDSKSADAKDMLLDAYPSYTVMSLSEDLGIQEMTSQLTKLFFILFALCIMMIIFVSISISERIVCERMAVIGTLRSLGLSTKLTTVILLVENAFYGLIGSAVGCLIYNVIRTAVFSTFIKFNNENITYNFDPVNPLIFLAVILGAIVIECLCPIKEIIRAMNLPIRDIIFSNKDTEYKINRISTIVGLVCLTASIVLLFVPSNYIVAIINAVLFTIALATLFPYALTFCGKLLSRLGEHLNKPIFMLASTECYTKKSTVGAATLITTASALAIVVFTFSSSINALLDTDMFTSQIMVSTVEVEREYLSFIEHLDSVNDVEYIYGFTDKINLCEYLDKKHTDCSDMSVKDKKKYDAKYSRNISLVGIDDDGYKYFSALQDIPSLARDEVAVGEVLANKLGLKVGDQITFTILEDSYYPYTATYTIKSINNVNNFDSSGDTIILNQDLLIDIYGDTPTIVLVDCDDPVNVDKLIETYGTDYINQSQTSEEYSANVKSSNASLLAIIYLIVIFGVGLTFIGSVSNLLIGFDGRRRELAVLCSTAMPRKKASRLLLLESIISTGIALICALPFSLLMIKPVYTALAAISLNLDIKATAGTYLGFALILWLIFTLTSFFPRRALRKMKLAEQLKYE